MNEPILEVDELQVQYKTNDEMITAASDVSFSISEGEYFGLVGESGCGKSTIAKAILGGLDPNGHITGGKIRYKGQEIQNMSEAELNKNIRWTEISYIPQGSMNSLDPLQRIREQALEIAHVHTSLSDEEAIKKFRQMFKIVGIPEDRINDYPHEFSGGMQQRAIIALALFLSPSVIIADEPTTALDVIMQDQIFKHLDNIKKEMDTSMLMITHNISLVFESCEKMAIMHSGQLAETGTVTQLFDNPQHPYSILLQEAFPDIRFPKRDLQTIEGAPPQTVGAVNYCTFADRCPWSIDECQHHAPSLESTGDTENHKVACIRRDEIGELYADRNGDSSEYMGDIDD